MHSLISPHDYRTQEFEDKSSFTDQEVQILKDKLNIDIRDYQTETYFCDPSIFNQQIGLVSFVPSKGATPDKDGFYGMMKIRGNYVNEEEANIKAEDLIRNVDSYHEIFHCKVGKPFPITNSTNFSEEIKEIDIKKKSDRNHFRRYFGKEKRSKGRIKRCKGKRKKFIK